MSVDVKTGEQQAMQAFAAPSRTIVTIHPDGRARDTLRKVLLPFYDVADFPDATTAIGRVSRAPAATLVGEAALDPKDPPLARLRREPLFKQSPIILVGSNPAAKAEADAIIPASSDGRAIADLVVRLVNRQVEAGWEKLPDGPRKALRGSLAAFDDLSSLVKVGGEVDYDRITQACDPVLEAVKSNEHAHIFDGLKNHGHLVYVHSLRVSVLLALFGYTVGLDDESLMILASGGLMADLGKTSLPEPLIHKVTPLESHEREEVNRHVDAGVDFLRRQPGLPKAVVAIAAQHHERMDGSGYPHGLKGSELNNLVRMAGIVDVFAALTERRPYRAAMSPFQALAVMQENIREKFDQSMLKLFRGMLLKAA